MRGAAATGEGRRLVKGAQARQERRCQGECAEAARGNHPGDELEAVVRTGRAVAERIDRYTTP